MLASWMWDGPGALWCWRGFTQAQGTGMGARRGLLFMVVALWGLRLALHLLVDRVIGKPEALAAPRTPGRVEK